MFVDRFPFLAAGLDILGGRDSWRKLLLTPQQELSAERYTSRRSQMRVPVSPDRSPRRPHRMSK